MYEEAHRYSDTNYCVFLVEIDKNITLFVAPTESEGNKNYSNSHCMDLEQRIMGKIVTTHPSTSYEQLSYHEAYHILEQNKEY